MLLFLLAIGLLHLTAACGARTSLKRGEGEGARDRWDAARPSQNDANVDGGADFASDGSGHGHPADTGLVDNAHTETTPHGWQSVAVGGGAAVIYGIHGVSDQRVWLVGQQLGKPTLWELDQGSFVAHPGPPTSHPLRGVWTRQVGTSVEVWVIGQRKANTEAALWRRDAQGAWLPLPLPVHPQLDLVAIDGTSDGEVFVAGNTDTAGLALVYSPKGGWSERLFSAPFPQPEARDVVALGAGRAWLLVQRAKGVQFWSYAKGAWQLDQEVVGYGRSITAAGTETGFAAGRAIWQRTGTTWTQLGGKIDYVDAHLIQGHGSEVFVASDATATAEAGVARLYGGRLRWRRAPSGHRPRGLWLSDHWVWIATEQGTVFRYHLLSF